MPTQRLTRGDKLMICLLVVKAVLLGIVLGMAGVSVPPWTMFAMSPLILAVALTHEISE